MAFVSIVPVAPLRAEPSHRTEMVSQLLFGELCEAGETAGDFIKVTCKYDGYEGWCQRSQLEDFVHDDYNQPITYIHDRSVQLLINDQACDIPFGSVVMQAEDKSYQLGGVRVEANENIHGSFARTFDSDVLIKYARLYLGTSYLWGGKSIYGVDCSGYMQQLYKMFGIALPRDAYQQAEIGMSVGFLQETKPGDLAFFDNEEGRITHVGMLLNDHHIIHSSGNVRIDQIDHAGIMNSFTGKRTHRLRLIKRVAGL